MTEKTPIWIQLAFSSIQTRRSALILILAAAIFAIYCVPWSLLFIDTPWLETFFLITDWSWLAMMVPIIIWYLLALRWMDKHAEWK